MEVNDVVRLPSAEEAGGAGERASRGLGAHGVVGLLTEGGVGLQDEAVTLDGWLSAAAGDEALGAEARCRADAVGRSLGQVTLVGDAGQVGFGRAGASAAVGLAAGQGQPGVAVDGEGATGRATGHGVGRGALEVGELEGGVRFTAALQKFLLEAC